MKDGYKVVKVLRVPTRTLRVSMLAQGNLATEYPLYGEATTKLFRQPLTMFEDAAIAVKFLHTNRKPQFEYELWSCSGTVSRRYPTFSYKAFDMGCTFTNIFKDSCSCYGWREFPIGTVFCSSIKLDEMLLRFPRTTNVDPGATGNLHADIVSDPFIFGMHYEEDPEIMCEEEGGNDAD